MEKVSQYEIVLVNLDPTLGREIKKKRPCVIVSPNEMNYHLQTVVIAPMTTTQKNYPTRVSVRHDDTDGWVAVDQIRTIDKLRIQKKLGKLSQTEIQRIKDVIREAFVD